MRYTILHTIETGGPGGAETVLYNLVSRIDPFRFRSVVLLPDDGWLREKLRQERVRTFLARSGGWYDPRLLKSMAALVRKQKVDLIHSHLPDQNFYSCLVGQLTGRKVVVTYHGSQHLCPSEEIKCVLKQAFVRRTAAAIVVVSDYLKQLLQNRGFPVERIARIHNGIDANRFTSAPTGHLRAQLGCPNGTKLVGMVANIRRSKGYEYFVRAARMVADLIPQVRFVAIGEVENEIGGRLVKLIRELDLQDCFYFLGFRADVPQILADLDLFVLSSITEGFSMATVEAMAAGKPVVVTRSGGPEEIVEDGSTGLLVPPADASILAARICEVLSNPALASALGQRAKAVARNEFALPKMVNEYERLYERCLS